MKLVFHLIYNVFKIDCKCIMNNNVPITISKTTYNLQ